VVDRMKRDCRSNDCCRLRCVGNQSRDAIRLELPFVVSRIRERRETPVINPKFPRMSSTRVSQYVHHVPLPLAIIGKQTVADRVVSRGMHLDEDVASIARRERRVETRGWRRYGPTKIVDVIALFDFGMAKVKSKIIGEER